MSLRGCVGAASSRQEEEGLPLLILEAVLRFFLPFSGLFLSSVCTACNKTLEDGTAAYEEARKERSDLFSFLLSSFFDLCYPPLPAIQASLCVPTV